MRSVVLILSLVGFLGTAHAGVGRDNLNAFMSELGSLEARFEQTVLDTENNRTGLFHGIFMMQRPKQFRWEYVSPEPSQIIADGRDLWMVDEDLQQVTQHYQPIALRGTPAALLVNSKPLEDDFKIVELGEKRKLQWLELLPKDEDNQVTRILLAFRGPDLVRLELVDKFGQISRFHFFEIKRNPELDQALFRFEPPPGWDVLEQE